MRFIKKLWRRIGFYAEIFRVIRKHIDDYKWIMEERCLNDGIKKISLYFEKGDEQWQRFNSQNEQQFLNNLLMSETVKEMKAKYDELLKNLQDMSINGEKEIFNIKEVTAAWRF